jgi:Rps23 Pro-64 3,4-dihydroxylase Tpa1-like proline 4-hydroxylase
MIENDSKKDDIYLANVAKLGSSAKNVYVVNNFLSNEEHKELSNYVNNPNEVCWIREPWSTERTQKDSIPENILKLLKKIFQTSRLNSVDYYGIDLSDDFLSQYLLTKWSKGSKMLPHVDTDAQKHQHIVCMYYINDDYDGGEIVFPDYNLTIKPKSNSLVMFPGNENYVHGVLEVSKGFRYTFPMRFAFAGSTFLGPTAQWKIDRKN